MIRTIAVKNYRSIRQLELSLAPLTVVTGKNGAGKSNLYKALQLLADSSQGNLIQRLTEEGGFASTFWAGPEDSPGKQVARGFSVQGTRPKEVKNLSLGFASDGFGYILDCGVATDLPHDTRFRGEPDIKREIVFTSDVYRPSTSMVERRNSSVKYRDEDHQWEIAEEKVRSFESVFDGPAYIQDLHSVSYVLNNWRFYDHLRTDADSPLRKASLPIRTLSLPHDGSNLAASLQTIRELGNQKLLDELLREGLAGAEVGITDDFNICVRQEGLLRPLAASELSDGMIKYIALCTALLSPAEPELIVLNEPENSIHEDLIPALAKLIKKASETTQLLVVTHHKKLEELLATNDDAKLVTLIKECGETVVEGQGLLDSPRWEWGSR